MAMATTRGPAAPNPITTRATKTSSSELEAQATPAEMI